MEQWKDRVIYQALTDRFDKSTSNTAPCNDFTNYCGGTFKGLTNRLNYLRDLGVDAIWISPVVENTEGGYHGYWAKNLYTINSHFGTAADLKTLVSEAHKLGMYVMIDVVANHMGSKMEDIPYLNPFNKTTDYHDCGCVNGDCCPDSCWVEDYNNHQQMLHCQLFGLPDLNHELSSVRQEFTKWVKYIVSEYSFDGIRIDTVPYVNQSFWNVFTKSAGVYSVGEVSTSDYNWCASYVKDDSMDATLQYPLYHDVINVFAYRASMRTLGRAIANSAASFGPENIPFMGLFLENHDNPRFLTQRNDMQANRNAIAFTLMTTGIPIVYYGQEQGYHGGTSFDDNREPLWTSGFRTADSYGDMYNFIKSILTTRKSFSVNSFHQEEIFMADDFYAFSRGNVLIALTNVGYGGAKIERILSGWGVPYKAGTTVCNIFHSTDCQVIEADYNLKVVLENGEPKIFVPAKK